MKRSNAECNLLQPILQLALFDPIGEDSISRVGMLLTVSSSSPSSFLLPMLTMMGRCLASVCGFLLHLSVAFTDCLFLAGAKLPLKSSASSSVYFAAIALM